MTTRQRTIELSPVAKVPARATLSIDELGQIEAVVHALGVRMATIEIDRNGHFSGSMSAVARATLADLINSDSPIEISRLG